MGQKTNGQDTLRFHYNRLKSVLALQQTSFERLCQALPVHERHAYFVLTNQRRGSAKLLDAIRGELGESGWLFITGQSHTLQVEESPHAA